MARTAFSRQDLLLPLADVFRRRGYEGATLTELSRVTGLGKASLYHHFPGGKAEMAEALVRFAIADLEDRAFRHLARNTPWYERISSFIDGFAEYVDDGKTNCLLAVLAIGAQGGELAQPIKSQMREWTHSIAAAFVESGLGEKAARRHAREMLISLEGALVMARMLDSTKAFKSTVKRLHRELDGAASGSDEPDERRGARHSGRTHTR